MEPVVAGSAAQEQQYAFHQDAVPADLAEPWAWKSLALELHLASYLEQAVAGTQNQAISTITNK